nr:hypothetical protein BaRGS_027657 [Batillaria attramentaria]
MSKCHSAHTEATPIAEESEQDIRHSLLHNVQQNCSSEAASEVDYDKRREKPVSPNAGEDDAESTLLHRQSGHKPEVSYEVGGEDEDDVEEDDGVPYDRGWAWMVVLGSFVNFALLTGYLRARAVFFVDLLRQFRAPASQTALLFAIHSGVYSLSGVYVMNVILGRLGCRKTALIGAILLSLSAILSSLANDLTAIICLQSILLGIADAMLISPSEVLMAAYFRRRRSLGIAIAKVGASVGILFMPLLVAYLLDHYGLHGALLLTGGACLHSVPAVLLLRPTSYFTKRQRERRERECVKSGCGRGGVGGGGTSHEVDCRNGHSDAGNVHDGDFRKGDRVNKECLGHVQMQTLNNGAAHELTSSTGSRRNEDLGHVQMQTLNNGVIREPDSRRGSRWNEDLEYAQMQRLNNACIPTMGRETNLSRNCEGALKIPTFGRQSKCIAMNNDDKGLETRNGQSCGGTSTETHAAQPKSGTKPHDVRPDSGAAARTQQVLECLKSSLFVLDLSLFRRPLFRLLFLYCLLCSSVNVTNSYLPAVATENGVSEQQAALLLSIIGGLDVVSRLGSGLLADKKVIRVPTMIIASFLVLGTCNQLVRFMTSFPHFVALAVLQGLLAGVSNCMVPILMLEFVGVENMGKGIGFFILASGAFMAGFYPLLGYIRDITGSYAVVYHVIGGTILAAAGLLSMEGVVRRWERREEICQSL